tara:strand:+ start:1864 stop:2544 length:681 start_codon:yes stop_codon:yes gene_type:complete
MKLKNILILTITLFVTSCTTNIVSKGEAFPVMYQESPLSILVLPPINLTTAADAKDYYLTTIAEPLSKTGYYVLPIEIVNQLLINEGIYDSETLLNTNPQIFNDYFGADAILFTTIKRWDTSYLVVAGSVTVHIHFELKSAHSGALLWSYNDSITIDTTGDNDIGGTTGLLLALIETAVSTAVTDYVPIAKQVNIQVLNTIPYGKYHSGHNTDQTMGIVNKSKTKN